MSPNFCQSGKWLGWMRAALLFTPLLTAGAGTITVISSPITVDTRDYPEIAVVRAPTNNNLTSGGTEMVGALPGATVSRTYGIRNVGSADLTGLNVTLSGPDASFFGIVTQPPTTLVAPSGSTAFMVRFSPTTAGNRTATLQIANNDPDENPFVIQLSGKGLTFTEDSDSDGLNDGVEAQMAALGFDWQANQSALVQTYYANANAAGLYTTQQVQALNAGTPFLTRNAATGRFKLTLRIRRSTSLLAPFNPFPLNAPQATTVINPQGDLEFEFATGDNAAFFQLEAR